MNKYKEKFKNEWGVTKYTIQEREHKKKKKRRKGMLIYQETRENHVEGMVGLNGDEEVLLENHDYLIFDIPDDIDPVHFKEIKKNCWMSVQLRWFNGWTEVACHHPQVFHCGVLEKLEELGYITVTQKEIPNDKRSYPYYVNAKGWKVVYNLINQLREGIKNGGSKMANQISKEEVEFEPDLEPTHNKGHEVEEETEERNAVEVSAKA